MKVDHLSDAELALRPHRVTGPVMDAFLQAAAIHPSRALAYRPKAPDEQEQFERLVASNVLVPVSGDRHWLDLRRHYEVENQRGAMRAAIGFGIAVSLMGVAVLFYTG